jgi:hypothetical protein
LRSCCNRLSYLPCNLTPLDIKGEVGAPHRDNFNTTPIAMSNIRTRDVGLLSSGRPEPI